jgi:hypothetical protein
MFRWLTIGSIALCALGCGGGSGSSAPERPTPPADAASKEPSPEQKQALAAHKARQAEICEKLCPRRTECILEDVRSKESKDSLKELDLEKSASATTQKCVEDCKNDEISARQLRVYEVCLKEAKCADVAQCMLNAEPKQDQAPK